MDDLILATQSGNLEEVQYRISRDKINKADMSGQTPLMYAAIGGHLEISQILLENGADVNAICTWGSSLQFACEKSNTEIARLLLSYGADVNYSRKDYYSSLILAIKHPSLYGRKPDLELIKLLVESGAKINFCEKNGLTALIYALENKEYTIAKYLIKNGANVIQAESKGRKGLRGVFGPDDAPIFYGLNNKNILKKLIKKGADVNVVGKFGVTPLMSAVGSRYTKIKVVKFLIDKGAKINIFNRLGDSVLSEAASVGNVEIIKLLIENGADVNAVNNDGQSVLIRVAKSARSYHIKVIVQMLIDQGASLNVIDNKGRTALHYAAENYIPELYKLLAFSKENLYLPDKEGNSPEDIAAAAYNRSKYERHSSGGYCNACHERPCACSDPDPG